MRKYSHSAEFKFKSVQMEEMEKKIQEKTSMPNNSLKCIASWFCESNVLDLVFNSKSISVNFKTIFLTKSTVKFNILF